MFMCNSCGKTYDLDRNIQLCECDEPLHVGYFSGEVGNLGNVWNRYEEFLPSIVEKEASLGEGDTPLMGAEKLSAELNVDLYLKNETVNPTWSFKDRGTFLGLLRAKYIEKEKLGTVSTGNMAASVSAYGARNGMDSLILVSSDISEEKLEQIEPYEPKIVEVEGDYGDLYYESLDLGRDDIYFTVSNSPFRVEGYKTISFEICEEVIPDYIMIPTSSGGLFRGLTKGFAELEKNDLIDAMPTLVGVQAEGCSPIHRAHDSGKDQISRWSEPESIAGAISNPLPPGGNDVLKKLEKYDGLCISVSDREILSAQKSIAGEGIFCQPSSSVGVAALKKLRESEKIEKGSEVVSIITGSGLKGSATGPIGSDTHRCKLNKIEDCIDNIYDDR